MSVYYVEISKLNPLYGITTYWSGGSFGSTVIKQGSKCEIIPKYEKDSDGNNILYAFEIRAEFWPVYNEFRTDGSDSGTFLADYESLLKETPTGFIALLGFDSPQYKIDTRTSTTGALVAVCKNSLSVEKIESDGRHLLHCVATCILSADAADVIDQIITDYSL